MSDEIRLKAERLIRILKTNGWTVSTAESCTGGLVAAAITAVPGASAVFYEGVVVYSDEAKTSLLNVASETLFKRGSISEECAGEMAENLEKLAKCDLALSVTGFAGPTGGTPTAPIGTVWFAARFHGRTVTRVEHIPGDRDDVRRIATLKLLLLGLETLNGN
ncbi:MAG TPA: damage-inducible protein CinA [Acholeplasmatales bacterium]|nr:damage-inducible protein CinA [Acholeplasmatales bacterium]